MTDIHPVDPTPRGRADAVRRCDPALLAERARLGDPDLLADLFACYHDDLTGFLRQRCSDDTDAEDALQDAFVAAARYLDGFRGDAAIRTWLYRLASSACTRLRRGAKGDRRRHDSLDDAGPLASGGTGGALSPESGKAAVESMLEARLAPLREALDALGNKDRAVLLLREAEGLSTRETAEALGLTETAVKTRLSRARRAVRDALE